MSVHVDFSVVFSLGSGSCLSASLGIIIGSLMFYGLEDLLGRVSSSWKVSLFLSNVLLI